MSTAVIEKTNLKLIEINGRSVSYLDKGTGAPSERLLTRRMAAVN